MGSDTRATLERTRRQGLSIGALIVGLMLTIGFYVALASLHLPRDYALVRYTTGHWILYATVGMFFWGMSDLVAKWLRLRREHAALRFDWLDDHGSAVPASEANTLLEEIESAPRWLLQTSLGRRLWNAIADVHDKQASEHLEEHLKYLAELEEDESHSSYALCRVIAWMIPILGFLGTVVGITMAIGIITPEQLESSLPAVTGGLGVAFDTTALSLTLSMILIFTMFLVERSEQNVLRSIERKSRRLLGHRFLCSTPASTPYLSAVHAASEQVIAHTRALVERQTQLWSKSMEDLQRQVEEINARRETTFANAMKTIADQWRRDTQTIDRTHQQMDQMQTRLAKIAELLVQRTGEERALIAAQDRLAENLRMLRQTQNFDEALHSLTAAVHLLTVRVRSTAEAPTPPAAQEDSLRDRRVA